MNLRYGLYPTAHSMAPTPPARPAAPGGRVTGTLGRVLRPGRSVLAGVAGLVLGVGVFASAGASAAPDEETPDEQPAEEQPLDDLPADDLGDAGGSGTEQPPVTLPLVPVPVGCTPAVMPQVVFVGRVVDRDYRTARFRIEQIRAGSASPFASRDLVDIRMGLDAQYLDDGERYLVGAVVDPDLGLLVSRVTPPIEHFGGDDVIGVSESDVDCPAPEDPMRTLHLDGTAIDASVIEPFLDARVRIASAFLVPFAIAVGVIFVLATFRLSVSGLYHSVVDGPGRRR